MTARAAASPGGALLRSSRLFSIPKPLPEAQSTRINLGEHKSDTMTRPYPQYQAITSPMSSREKGDWGFKRPFPLKSTMTTSTPLIRVKQVDSTEDITDFASAADLTLSLEKFQELRLAPSLPDASTDQFAIRTTNTVSKGVFEEDMDITDPQALPPAHKRWNFEGPWLARLDEGSFTTYLNKKVRPKRAEFRALLKDRMADKINEARTTKAQELGEEPPARIEAKDIPETDFTEFLRTMRHDRATLYSLVSDFLDFAPLDIPVGIWQSMNHVKSPYGRTGPPATHPSAGIGYLRTNSVMENHPVYGPQNHRAPFRSRILSPRQGAFAPKLGVGGFVVDVPVGSDTAFNVRHRSRYGKSVVDGITHLDTSSYGGAKAPVRPHKASIDPSGKVIIQVQEADPVANLIAEETRNPRGQVYNTKDKKPEQQARRPQRDDRRRGPTDTKRMDRVAEEILPEPENTEAQPDAKTTPQYFGLDR